MRCDLWICRLAALAVGFTAGSFYVIRHIHWIDPFERNADIVALAIVVGVASWLVVSLEISKRREPIGARLAPGLVLGAAAGIVLVAASSFDALPFTAGDAAMVFAIGMLGSAGVLVTPGSRQENLWSKAKFERDLEHD